MTSVKSLLESKYLLGNENKKLPAIFVPYEKNNYRFNNCPVYFYVPRNSHLDRVPRNVRKRIRSFFDMHQWRTARYKSLYTVCEVHNFYNDDRTYTHQVKEYRDWKRSVRHALDDTMGHIYGIMEVKTLKTPQNKFLTHEFHIRIKPPDRLQ